MNQKQLTYIAIGLGGLVILVVVLGLVFGWFKKGVLDLVQGEGEVDRTPTGAIDENRYYNIARSAKNSLTGTNWNSDHLKKVSILLLALNPNELRVVSNIYNRDFATQEAASLRLLVSQETPSWFFVCTSYQQNTLGHVCNYQKKVIDKLNSINA